MPDFKKQGGPRRGAGRKGKTKSDRLRSRLWYTLVALSIRADASTPPSVVGQMLEAEASRLAPHLINTTGSPTAYISYRKGDSKPDKAISANVDKLLIELGLPAIKWVLSRPGEMKLTPVYSWCPLLSLLSTESVFLCGNIEKMFWQRIPPSICVPELLGGGTGGEFPGLAHPKVSDDLESAYERGPDIKWPPLMLLPLDFAESKTIAPAEGIPYPSFFKSIPSDTPRVSGPSDLDRLQFFSNWSRSSTASMSGGNEWLEMIRCCLEPPSPIDLLMWPPDGRKDLMRDIAEKLEIKFDEYDLQLSPAAAILARLLLSEGDIVGSTEQTGPKRN